MQYNITYYYIQREQTKKKEELYNINSENAIEGKRTVGWSRNSYIGQVENDAKKVMHV